MAQAGLHGLVGMAVRRWMPKKECFKTRIILKPMIFILVDLMVMNSIRSFLIWRLLAVPPLLLAVEKSNSDNR